MPISKEDIKRGKIIGEVAFEFGMFDGYDVSLIKADGKRESLVTGMNSALYNYMMELIAKDNPSSIPTREEIKKIEQSS